RRRSLELQRNAATFAGFRHSYNRHRAQRRLTGKPRVRPPWTEHESTKGRRTMSTNYDELSARAERGDLSVKLGTVRPSRSSLSRRAPAQPHRSLRREESDAVRDALRTYIVHRAAPCAHDVKTLLVVRATRQGHGRRDAARIRGGINLREILTFRPEGEGARAEQFVGRWKSANARSEDW